MFNLFTALSLVIPYEAKRINKGAGKLKTRRKNKTEGVTFI